MKVGKGTALASSIRDWSPKSPPKAHGGIYLDIAWLSRLGIVGHRLRCRAGFPAMMLHWPDMQTPNEQQLALALKWAGSLLDAGQSVEVACIGGHGRTGTFLGCLLREYGLTGAQAISMVRQMVCPKCIETKAQEALIRDWS